MLAKPERVSRWLHVPVRDAVDVIIVGDAQSYWTHWLGPVGGRQLQPVRCVEGEAQASCRWYAEGLERRVRYVLPVRSDGGVRLCELGRVQYPALAGIESTGGLIGARVRLVREWGGTHAAICVRLLGREVVAAVDVVDIEAEVSALLRGQLRLFGAASLPPSKLSLVLPSVVGGNGRGVR